MAVPSRHGRHAAHRRRGGATATAARSRRTAPLVAFLAVLAIALGGWSLLGRGGPAPDARKAGLLADARDGDRPAGATTAPADRGSRDGGRVAPVPRLGTVVPGTPGRSASPGGTRTTPAGRPAGTRTSTPPAPPAPTGTAPGTPGTTAENEVTRLTNVERVKAGCQPVRTDARLAAAAEAHSRDMVDRDYFSHTTPDGGDPGDRASAAGYPRWSGENIAAGYPTPAAVVQGWMDSPGHRANILNCSSRATGVGFDERKNMWTQMFGFE